PGGADSNLRRLLFILRLSVFFGIRIVRPRTGGPAREVRYASGAQAPFLRAPLLPRRVPVSRLPRVSGGLLRPKKDAEGLFLSRLLAGGGPGGAKLSPVGDHQEAQPDGRDGRAVCCGLWAWS